MADDTPFDTLPQRAPTAQMDLDTFKKAADSQSYENAMIGLEGGGKLLAYRTKPGEFNEAQLHALQDTLARDGLHSGIQESVPGKAAYLFVEEADAPRLKEAIVKDTQYSLAGKAYAERGIDATNQDIARIAAGDPPPPMEYPRREQSPLPTHIAGVTRVPQGTLPGETNTFNKVDDVGLGSISAALAAFQVFQDFNDPMKKQDRNSGDYLKTATDIARQHHLDHHVPNAKNASSEYAGLINSPQAKKELDPALAGSGKSG